MPGCLVFSPPLIHSHLAPTKLKKELRMTLEEVTERAAAEELAAGATAAMEADVNEAAAADSLLER